VPQASPEWAARARQALLAVAIALLVGWPAANRGPRTTRVEIRPPGRRFRTRRRRPGRLFHGCPTILRGSPCGAGLEKIPGVLSFEWPNVEEGAEKLADYSWGYYKCDLLRRIWKPSTTARCPGRHGFGKRSTEPIMWAAMSGCTTKTSRSCGSISGCCLGTVARHPTW